MSELQTFQVFPNIPKPLMFLEALALNMWWSWAPDAQDLFRRIDPRIWSESGRNPLVFLTRLPQERLERLAEDKSFLSHLDRVKALFEERIQSPQDRAAISLETSEVIAYFSMEFGIHESLPLFAGGLGVLAGDHLKSASNLNLPLVGIGLLYRDGYFRQFLDANGWQQEAYPQTNLYHLPVERAEDTGGNDLRITVEGPEGPIRADVWKISVGGIPLYLLDANLHDNPPQIREVTSRLYAADQRFRLSQEVLLGIGGIRSLSKIGLFPKVVHMNEGHSAFSSIERLAQTMEHLNVSLSTAKEIVPRATIFTTHTPVAAGHDEFPVDIVKPIFVPFADRLDTTVEEILAWGQPDGSSPEAPFSMFILGLRMAQYCNGVSKLHGKVARNMWAHLWPRRPKEEVPISYVTNGIHVSTFISDEFARLFEFFLGPEWYMASRKAENISRIDDIYDDDLWRAHETNRSRLIRACRKMLAKQYARRNAPRSVMEQAETALNPEALTIGFARRFATYKRANLVLQDPDRLEAILSNDEFPVQFIFAGKAHPKDNEGKQLIQNLVQFAQKRGIRDKVIFVEDYDMHLARMLVQGTDVWMNTPRRPFEACGTSGMKAAINGGLNLSVLDGWWCEGYGEDRGWAIGHGEEYTDTGYQDAVESQALYNTLETDVIPCFYDRKNGASPTRWIQMMKAAMKMAMESFCSLRMVSEYQERFYAPAARRHDELVAENAVEAGNIADQTERLHRLWKEIRVDTPIRAKRGLFRVGDSLEVTANVFLGELLPEEVDVELYYGLLKSVDVLKTSLIEPMQVSRENGNGEYLYSSTIRCKMAGRYGFTARVTPRGDDRLRFTPKLLSWA